MAADPLSRVARVEQERNPGSPMMVPDVARAPSGLRRRYDSGRLAGPRMRRTP